MMLALIAGWFIGSLLAIGIFTQITTLFSLSGAPLIHFTLICSVLPIAGIVIAGLIFE